MPPDFNASDVFRSRGPSESGSLSSAEGLFDSARRASAVLSDHALATTISAVLFVCAAYPLLLTEVPPYQDVPNHLASVTVLNHLAEYPEFVSNGFFKTNAALFAWLHVAGAVMGTVVALKAFAFGVLAANAFVLPRVVLAVAGRQRMIAASFFMWPMIHNWFVSSGMLDFALAVPLALCILMRLERQRTAPTRANMAAIVALTLATWYAHVFALLTVFGLVSLEIARTLFERGREAARERGSMYLPPLVPVGLLVGWSLARHVTEPQGEWTGYVDVRRALPAWELVYNAWAEWLYAFTWLSTTSILVALGLVVYGWKNRTEERGFFSPLALLALTVLYVFSPYCITNWFHVSSRLLPFLWVAMLVRVPARLPRALTRSLVAAAAVYFVGLGVDFVRLDRERVTFTEGIAAVPDGARLLPLVFKQKETSDNTRNILHLWGYYVTEKHTSAPLLFAHSRAFPVMYKAPPPVRFHQLVLENFASSMATPAWTCNVLRTGGVTADACEGVWRERWTEFWADATPRFDHVLAWDITPEAEALVPPVYKAVFRNEKLVVYERVDPRVALLDP